MDFEAKQIIDILSKYLGSSAGLFFIREQNDAKINTALMNLSESEREQFIRRICNNLLSKVMSPQKIVMIRSKLYSVLKLNEKFNSKVDIEGLDWN